MQRSSKIEPNHEFPRLPNDVRGRISGWIIFSLLAKFIKVRYHIYISAFISLLMGIKGCVERTNCQTWNLSIFKNLHKNFSFLCIWVLVNCTKTNNLFKIGEKKFFHSQFLCKNIAIMHFSRVTLTNWKYLRNYTSASCLLGYVERTASFAIDGGKSSWVR